MRTIRPVIQEDTTGCGLACIATLAGKRYQQVKQVAGQLGINVQDTQLWSDTKYVRRLLTHFGISASPYTNPFKSWDTLPTHALLAIKWHKSHNGASWHWVVFWRGSKGPVVLDPKQSLQNNARTDFGRMKPKWFLTIEPTCLAHTSL